jgi:sugar phosphate isomerase/epimerase
VNIISFMSANYVARQVNYHMTDGWMQGDAATQAWFEPLPTFEQRFGALLDEIVALEFSAFDLWLAHLHPDWASETHIQIARRLIEARHLQVVSLAGGFGDTREAFERTCTLAAQLGTGLLGGGTPLLASDRAFVTETLRAHSLRLGIENHPEKTTAELLARMGSGDEDVIGAAVDTGWFGTQGYDAAAALAALDGRLFHIHLKDVLAVGAHDTCRFGQGIVGIESCVKALQRIGYGAAISVEHEPELYDPTEDVRASRNLLVQWLGQ